MYGAAFLLYSAATSDSVYEIAVTDFDFLFRIWSAS